MDLHIHPAHEVLAKEVEAHLEELGRREHVAATLRQLGCWCADLELDLADLALAYEVCGQGQSGPDSREKSRTRTCAQLAELAKSVERHGTVERHWREGLQRAIAAWERTAERAAATLAAACLDERYRAMRDTALRELVLLRAALEDI